MISIIIPTYNSGASINAALQSVKQQLFQDWECIVVDGASKDNTLDIVKSYCEDDTRFRYISEKDNGIYDAFNKGWKLAKGEWVYYLGSDDTLTEDGMAVVAKELDNDFAVVTGDVNIIRGDGSVRPFISKGYLCCHQGVVMQRKVLEEANGFDEQYRIIADHDLLAKVEKAGKSIKNVHVFLANFSTAGASSKLSYQFKVMKETYRIDKKYGLIKYPFLNALYIFTYKCLSSFIRTR